MPVLQRGQSPFIELLQALGYKGNEEGMCYGFAHMLIQAILAGDLESAATRLDYICQHSKDEIVSAIAQAKEEEKKMPRNRSFPLTIDEAEDIDQRRKLIEIVAFMEGVELYHQPWFHADVFPQDTKFPALKGIQSASLTKPMRADDLYEVKKFAGIYDEKELESWLDNLQTIAQSHAFGIELSSDRHTIAIAYDPRKGWYFIDSNNTPMVIKVDQAMFKEYMKKNILESLYFNLRGGYNGYAAFSSTIYCNLADKHNADAMVNELNLRPEWQRLHGTNDKNKINAQDCNGATLTYLHSRAGDVNEVKKLIDAGADINIADRHSGLTPLQTAVLNGQDAMIDTFLACDRFNVNSFNKKGYSLLHWAIADEKKDLVSKLLQKGADPNFKNPKTGDTALHRAVNLGDNYAIVELLKLGASIDISNRYKETPFRRAVMSGKKDTVRCLIANSKSKIDLNQLQGINDSTLLQVAASSDSADICALLIKAGADVNAVDKVGNTALHDAARFHAINCARKLLSAKGIDLTARNKKGETAAELGSTPEIKQLLVNAEFLQVVTAGNVARANKLLQEGADINFQNPSDGNTALHIAIGKCDNHLLEMLLEQGARTDISNINKFNPVTLVAKNGNVDAAKLILERSKEKIDVNYTAPALHLMTALHFSALSSVSKDMCETLIKAGADVNAKIDGSSTLAAGGTPLILKISFGWKDKDSLDTVALLLNNNADANIADQRGNTALHYAARNGDIRCIQLLFAAKDIALAVKNNEGKTAADLASTSEIKQLLTSAASREKPDVNLTGAGKQGIFSTSPAANTDMPKPAAFTPRQIK